MPDRDDQLAQAEDDITAAVAEALEATADEFADAVMDATELVAARFSVGRITRMWGNRTRGLVRRLLGTAETAAQAAAEDVDAELPPGWDDLPGRYEEGLLLPDSIGQYVQVTEHLLRAVGDRLGEAARRELAAGVDAGEDIEQLRARLRAAFSREGSQLGPVREERTARTEASRAWNTATLAAARAVTGPGRPMVKQWVTRHDNRVRTAHDNVDGQVRLLAEPFTVAGVPMDAPGDPTAPARLVVNCRCRLAVAPEVRTAALESQDRSPAAISKPRENRVETSNTVTAGANGYSGAMIALVPTKEDAERLALATDDAEPAHELHLTLFYLGEGAAWSEQHRTDLIDGVRARVEDIGAPVAAKAFGAAHWNADGDSPSWVWSVGDDPDRPADAPTLESARWAAVYALENMHEQPDIPAQHSPWAGHTCAVYTGETWPLEEMNARLGPIRFDRIRVAFAGEHFDIPLGPEEETPMEDDDTPQSLALDPRPWSTPGDTALAFEDEETGDGRMFPPGSLYWTGAGPWPLQYADEMLMGHQGAELAGAIQTLDRDGGRIPASGVLYPSRPAGADACMLLEEKAPLGVSVDLDDVSVEFVDRTTDGEGEGEVMILASMSSASMLRLEDGSWAVTASATAEWSASGIALSRTATGVQLITGPDGVIPAAAVRAAMASGVITAAAGDPDSDLGTVVHRESSGDLLMRVTRARVRGATLVSMPAYDKARIVLDDQSSSGAEETPDDGDLFAGAGPSPTHLRVVEFVKQAVGPVGAREVARALRIRMESARGHLGRAAKAGRIVRLARGLYVAPSPEESQDDATAAALPSAGWDEADSMRDLVASAWSAMNELPPMPAAWFNEPTAEELPPGSGGVHYSAGRVWGWVAQAGVPHAGYPGKKVTIERLAREGLDFSHFLRAKFQLDDGSTVRVGALTMNVGHDGDGAQCDDAVCQFDNSGTVGAIVTVGMNKGGLWFSGAGAPWLSDWDKTVFRSCQPSYHLRTRRGGGWELRAVLDVPVPGHSSPLVAAVIERSNLALAASAAGSLFAPDVSGQHPDTAPIVSGHRPDNSTGTVPDLPGHRPDTVPDTSGQSDAVAALLTSVPFLDVLLEAMDRRQEQRDTAAREEAAQLAALVNAPARTTITASRTTTEGEA